MSHGENTRWLDDQGLSESRSSLLLGSFGGDSLLGGLKGPLGWRMGLLAAFADQRLLDALAVGPDWMLILGHHEMRRHAFRVGHVIDLLLQDLGDHQRRIWVVALVQIGGNDRPHQLLECWPDLLGKLLPHLLLELGGCVQVLLVLCVHLLRACFSIKLAQAREYSEFVGFDFEYSSQKGET